MPAQQDALTGARLTPYCPQAMALADAARGFQSPNFSQVPAPGFQPPVATPSGVKILPTGVATPTAPTIVYVPGYGTAIEPGEPAEQAVPQDMPGPASFSGVGMLAVALGVGFLFGGRRRK